MAFYADMQQMARDLLKPDSQGGLGQGKIVLGRTTTVPAPNPWDPATPTTVTETLRGAVKGISKELVGTSAGDAVLLMSDREAICEVPIMGYRPGDTLSVDGTPVIILSQQNIPAAGTVAAVRFFIRGA